MSEEDISILKDIQFNSSMLRSYPDAKRDRRSLAVKNVLERLKELEGNEKVIEEMAKYIEDNALDDICNIKGCYADKYVKGHCQKCIKCIIEHFRKRV